MSTSTPQISAQKALTEGILLEANRQFFHRFGLALAAEWDDESDWDGPADRLVLLDYRGDPEGMAFMTRRRFVLCGMRRSVIRWRGMSFAWRTRSSSLNSRATSPRWFVLTT